MILIVLSFLKFCTKFCCSSKVNCCEKFCVINEYDIMMVIMIAVNVRLSDTASMHTVPNIINTAASLDCRQIYRFLKTRSFVLQGKNNNLVLHI